MQNKKNLPILPENSGADEIKCSRFKDEQGIAMVLVMIALSLLTMFSSYLFLSSVEDLRVSDNGESMLQARFAARAGIDHAREVLRGIKFNDLLQGPDGTYSSDSTYRATALTARFRNWASLATLRSLNIANPGTVLNSLPDDGLINTGKVGTVAGTVLIPKTGTAFTVTNPYRSGTISTARYFVKVADNNDVTAETTGSSANNPFVDGDGTIIVRSIGVAGTIVEGSGTAARRNSIAIYEARFQQGMPFGELGSPVVVIGNNIKANFSGNAFDIIGNSTTGPGIGTVDTNTSDGYHPDQIIKTATGGKGNITGNCTGSDASQCIADITSTVTTNPLRSHLTDPDWLYDFVYNQVPTMADYKITNGGSIDSSNIGTASNPKITLCEYSCSGTGSWYGAGLLVVRGDLELGGAIRWDGLVLVVGKGEFWTHGMNRGIYGGAVVAGITYDSTTGHAHFTDANTDFDIRGNSNIASYDGSLTAMGNGLMPVKQISLREITNGMDP